MSARRRPPKPDLAQRLLTEIVCRREEAEGHPQHHPQAEAAARESGGDLLERARTRALALPGSASLLVRLRRLQTRMQLALVAGVVLALLAGVGAARLVLDAPTLNLPLVLLVLVGTNLMMLGLWLLLSALGGAASLLAVLPWPALAARLRLLDARDAADPVREALRILGGGSRGAALAATATHLGWLAYTLGGLMTLATAMALREFQFTWQTTLLAPETLQRVALALSWWPGWLGAAGPDTLPLQPPMSDGERQAWAIWLLVAVAVYGALPRMLAAIYSGARLQRGLRRLAADPHRPGIARLRARLLLDHRARDIIDPAPTADVEVAEGERMPPAPTAVPPPADLIAVSLEWPQGSKALGEPHWRWLPPVDDPADLPRLAAKWPDGGAGLVLAVRASATPDRGLERAIAALVAALPVPVWLALGEADRLHARGTAAAIQRVADWRALAARAGAQGLIGADPIGHGGPVRAGRGEPA